MTNVGWSELIQDFYTALAQVSFTVLGLWFVVIQLRRDEWRASRRRRLGARAIALDFALPGTMSLLTLANPDSSALWRVSFALFAVLGATGLGLLSLGAATDAGRQRPSMGWGNGLAVVLYAVIALVAIFAGSLAGALAVQPLQIEAVLLALLILVSLNVALGQLFEAGEERPG